MIADSKEWAIRICLEAQGHVFNCVVTLTYDEEHNDGSLHKEHYREFLRDLRKKLYPLRVRYFCSGEYGEKHNRPHYHIILFGWQPDDLYFWKKGKKGSDQYRSPFLETIWTRGFSTVGRISYDTAFYTAKYLQKLVRPEDDRVPPFVAMSTHPGIGAYAFTPEMLTTDKVYYAGKSIRLPRYFEKLAIKAGFGVQQLRLHRSERLFLYDKKKLRVRRFKALKKFGIIRI